MRHQLETQSCEGHHDGPTILREETGIGTNFKEQT